MKKLKILPTVLMLVLCVGILAVGVFALTPTKNTISGTITVNSSNPEVLISVYTVNAQGNMSAVPFFGPQTARSGIEIELGNALAFNTSNINSEDQLSNISIKMVIRVENPSTTQKLGVYFSSESMTGPLRDSTKVETVKELITEDDQDDIAQATLSGYSPLPVATSATNLGVCDMQVSFDMIKFSETNTSIDLENELNKLYLNIETYQGEHDESTINKLALKTNGNNVTVTAKVGNGTAQALTDTWKPEVAFDNAKAESSVENSYILPTQVITINVKNNSTTNPISASLVGNFNGNSAITVTVVNNPYIAPDATGQVTLQLTQNVSTTDTTRTPLDITGVNYSIEITELENTTLDIQNDRIKYDETGFKVSSVTVREQNQETGEMGDPVTTEIIYHYYVEFGENPYVAGEKLRWYIYAYDNDGTKTSINASGAPNPKTATQSYTYYFISEYVLSSVYANWSFFDSSLGYSGWSAYLDYLNGITVRDSMNTFAENIIEEYDRLCLSAGNAINLYTDFKLNEDVLFGYINGTKKFDAIDLSDVNFFYVSTGEVYSEYTFNDVDFMLKISDKTTHAESILAKSGLEGDIMYDSEIRFVDSNDEQIIWTGESDFGIGWYGVCPMFSLTF